jgi:predicted nucleic acid-binding protein
MNKAYEELNLDKNFYYFNNFDINDEIILRDKNDKHIIHLAKISKADYILTSDKDLLQSKYKEFIITPVQYFKHFVMS